MIFGRRKVRLPRVADKPPALAGTARQIINNLLVLNDGNILAGYRMGEARWDFTGESSKAAALDANAEVWAELALDGGRAVHERVTTRPYPVAAWARSLDLRTPHPLPDVEGAGETWNDHLARMQQRIAVAGLDDKIVYRYIWVGKVRPGRDVRSIILANAGSGVALSDKDVREVLAEEARIANVVTGWNATRMNEHQQAWLRMRSLAPGIIPAAPPSAGGWDEQSITALASDVHWSEEPFGRTVSIHAWQNGRRIERAVQVLTVARLNDTQYPGNGLEPWQTFAERAVDPQQVPFPVEWSLTGEMVTGADLESASEHNLRLALQLNRDYLTHAEPPPEYTDRGIKAALRIRDEVSTGQPVNAVRFRGTVDAIVTGAALYDPADPTRMIKTAAEVVEERAAALRRLYAAAPLRIEMAPVLPQSVKLAATIPGEPRERTASQRQIPVPFLAAGMPTATATVGDNRGPYLGYTRGSARRAVMHDPHYATEGQGERGRKQNMWLEIGSLGAGKSILEAIIAYNAARRGTLVVINDPSGPLGKLCEMPELAPYSNFVNLLEGRDGILNPCALIREPQPHEFADGERDADYEKALRRTSAERRALMIDSARRCMTPDLYVNDATLDALTEAARGFHWTQHSSMWDLMEGLGRIGSAHAARVRSALEDAATQPLLRLLFPEPGAWTAPMANEALLTVVSTPGIRRAADGTPRHDWNPEETGADVVLRLAAFYTDRLIYGKPRDARALAIFDEAEGLTDFGAGRGFLARLGRDHSKWNISVHLSLKSVNEQMLSGEIRNFLAGAFVGRMANEGAAEAVLDVLNITDKRYARTLMRLSEVAPGEFVHLDADGRVASIRVDADYHPRLKEALLTNPTPEGSQHWTLDEETL